MLRCPTYNEDYNKLKDLLGDEAKAHYFNSINNGFGLQFNPDGTPSKLYNKLSKYSEEAAAKLRYKLLSYEYLQEFGNWIKNKDNSGVLIDNEPLVLVQSTTLKGKTVYKDFLTMSNDYIKKSLNEGITLYSFKSKLSDEIFNNTNYEQFLNATNPVKYSFEGVELYNAGVNNIVKIDLSKINDTIDTSTKTNENSNEIYSKLGSKTQSEHIIIDNIKGRKPLNKIYTYEDFARDNKGVEVLVQYDKYKTPFKAVITGEVEEVGSGTDKDGNYKYVDIQVKSSTGKLLTVNPFYEISGDIKNKERLTNDSNLIREPKKENLQLSTKENPIIVYVDGSDIKGTGAIGFGVNTTQNNQEYSISGSFDTNNLSNLEKDLGIKLETKPSNAVMEFYGSLVALRNTPDNEFITIRQDLEGVQLWILSGLMEKLSGQTFDTKKKYDSWYKSLTEEQKQDYYNKIQNIINLDKDLISKFDWDGRKGFYAEDKTVRAIQQKIIDIILKRSGKIQYQWVKGHSGEIGNEKVDTIAKDRNNYNTFKNLFQQSINKEKSITNDNIIAYRTRGNNFLEAFEKDNAIGNPWSDRGYGLYKTDTVKEAVEEFIAWMIGERHTDKLQDYRQAIINKIPELKGKTIFYYKDLGEPSHATALDYLINKYDWDNQIETTSSELSSVDVYGVPIYDNVDKVNKSATDVINALKMFKIISSDKTMLNLEALKAFNEVFHKYLEYDLVSNNINNKVFVIKSTLNKLNELNIWSEVKDTLDKMFNKELEEFNKDWGNDLDVDLENDETFDPLNDNIFNINDLINDEKGPTSYTKYGAIIANYNSQINIIDKRIIGLKNKVRTLEHKLIENKDDKSILNNITFLKKKIADFEALRALKEDSIADLKKAASISKISIIFREAEKALVELKNIANSEDLTADDIAYAEKIFTIWSAMGDINAAKADGHHILFTDTEMADKSIFRGFTDDKGVYVRGLSSIAEEMKEPMHTINAAKANIVWQKAKEELSGKGLTKEQLLDAINDEGYINAYAFGISRVDDKLITAIHKIMQKAIIKGRNESIDTLTILDDLIKKVKDKYGNEWEDKLFQTFKNGKRTGDLVDFFIPEYYIQRSLAYKEAKNKNNYKLFHNFRKENEILMDVALIFPFNGKIADQQKYNAHIKMLKDNLGEAAFEYHYNLQLNKIHEYKAAYEAQKAYINAMDWTVSQKSKALKNWENNNSPYLYQLKYEKNLLTLSDGPYSKYNVVVPKRDKGWYDSKFEEISKDQDLLNLYNYITNLLQDLKYIVPVEARNNIKRNTLPYIGIDILGQLYNGKATMGVSALVDKVSQLMFEKSLKTSDNVERDLLTNKPIKNLKIPKISHKEEQIKEYIHLKKLQYNGIPTLQMIADWRQEALEKIAEDTKHSVTDLLKIYTIQVLTYKHKAEVDNLLSFSAQLMREREAQKKDVYGHIFKEKGGLKNINDMLEYALDVWRGYPIYKSEGVTNKIKHLSESEKAFKRKCEETIRIIDERAEELSKDSDMNADELAELHAERENLIRQINQLGSDMSGTKAANSVMSWYTILGMGFNAMAGVVNLGIGYLENSIRAADGRLMNSKDLHVAYTQVLSLLKSKKFFTANDRKIVNFNKRFNIVAKSMNELFNIEDNTTISYLRNKFKFLNPMIFNEITEFQNQMPLVIARLKKMEALDANGNKTTYWDALNEDMTVKEGYRLSTTKSNEDALIDMELHLQDLVNRTHGNYRQTEAKMYKKNILGRMAFQFRGWMPEGIASRWGKEAESELLGITVKGRWRSYSTLFRGTTVGDIHYSGLNNTLFTLKQLLRKCTYGLLKPDFSGRMSEVDAANMKANLQELFLLINITALYLIGQAAIDPDDRKKYRINILLNMLSRMQTDAIMYINPLAYKNISDNVIPALGLLGNLYNLGIYSGQYLTTFDDDYKEKFFKALAKNTPLATQVVRLKSYTENLF